MTETHRYTSSRGGLRLHAICSIDTTTSTRDRFMMRTTSAFALFVLSLLPAVALAQAGPQPTGQQAAAQPSASAASPAQSRAGALTREQYIHRAEERAAGRAAAQFDR